MEVVFEARPTSGRTMQSDMVSSHSFFDTQHGFNQPRPNTGALDMDEYCSASSTDSGRG